MDEDNYNVTDKTKYENLINAFQDDYSKKNLQKLTAKQMVYGNNDRGLYHRLKQETKIIGSIDVRNTNYGVFEKNGVIEPNLKFGETVEEAAKNFRESMIDILEASLTKDNTRIFKNNLPKTLKYKLASIYNPKFFLPIYSIEHINFFLKCLGYEVYGENPKDYFPRIHVLLNEKESNNITVEWSNHKYARLLYYMFGSPKKTEKKGVVFEDSEKEVIISTNNYMDKKIIEKKNLLDTPIKSKITFDPNRKCTKRDFEKENRKNAINGNIAEEKVIEFERERLSRIGRKDCIEKIEKVSDKNDAAGFDVKSYNEDGSERYIEVKSTVTNNFSFNLSINEFLAGKHYNEDYWLYFVSLSKGDIEIRTINNPFSKENLEKLDIQAVNYRVNMKFEK